MIGKKSVILIFVMSLLILSSVSAFEVVECSTDSDCVEGYSCVSSDTGSICVMDEYVCTSTDDCINQVGSGFECNNGLCEASETSVSCSENTDCAEGEVCDSGSCVSYCTIGEAECSDGIDNDGDGLIDYWGACYDGNTLYDCTDQLSAADCEIACGDLPYTGADENCVSPLDSSEVSFTVSEGRDFAPEGEQGFFAQLWDWIIFWK